METKFQNIGVDNSIPQSHVASNQIPLNPAAASAGVKANTVVDWRIQLQSDSRQRIVNKITDTLKRHLPIMGPEGLLKVKKIAVRFEEKIFSVATSQSDYLRKISLKMLTVKTKSQNIGVDNSIPQSHVASNQNPLNPDWRTQLQADSRQRIVNKIMDTLKRVLICEPEGLLELKKIAVRFEEKIYSIATSQSDYLRKISVKMLVMEGKSQMRYPTGHE
ncbi:hypothetical protein AQUCO_00900091v1 [Aquilegia coerulea]|uniref:Mediator complex subunit 15 KIX domain-containing protein n=1 Tax=Aquilegia coerulea TaxID=218851 RepID=A0A2G5EBW6_AQUCA|nr:hypothetical protein AQUCO_00900091v1 [Aquilegia coerulea]